MKQLLLFSARNKSSTNKNKANSHVRRVISTREFNHVILKSRVPILRGNHFLIHQVLQEAQKRYNIKLKTFSIMTNHIHLVIQVGSRTDFANAMRYFAGMIARKLAPVLKSLTGATKLWVQRVWSRIVKMGRDLTGVVRYVFNNPFRAGIAHPQITSSIDSFIILNGKLVDRIPYTDLSKYMNLQETGQQLQFL